MFNPFRRGSRSVRFDEQQTGAKSEAEEDAQKLVRRPSLARRLSATLLGRAGRSTSSAAEANDEDDSNPPTLLTWGRNDLHQLLRNSAENDNSSKAARQIPMLNQVVFGFFHTLAYSHTGSVYASGDNEEGQIDISKKPYEYAKRIAFQNDNILPISCAVGLNHSALVSKEGGMVLTWGSNELGQLGRKDTSITGAVQQVEGALRKERSIQVACTENATIVLTERGQVWSFGEPTRGELGRPDCTENFYLAKPVLGRLFCNPIAMISCGAGHVVALTQTGRAIGWGWNRHGQLGFDGGKRFECEPISLPLDIDTAVVYVNCGNQHTALQTANTVYTAGSNDFGQLVRGSNAVGFHQIDFDLPVYKVACGAFHTLLLTKDGEVWAVGSNEFGESTPNHALARVDLQVEGTVMDVFAGGNASACLVGSKLPRSANKIGGVLRLDCYTLQLIAQEAVKSGSLGDLKGALVGEFHCTGLNRSFFSNTTKSHVDAKPLATALATVCEALNATQDGQRFLHARCTTLFEELWVLAPIATEPDQLRCFFIALVHPANHTIPSQTFTMLIKAVAELRPKSLSTIMTWLFADMGSEFVDKQILKLLLRNAEYCVERRDWSRNSGGMPQIVLVIKSLHTASQGRIPFQNFYLHQPDMWPETTLFEEWSIYNKNKLLDADVYFSIFNYSVILGAETKRTVLMFDSRQNQMYNAFDAAVYRSEKPFLEISISRANLLRDALDALSKCKQTDLSKQLTVKFDGEPGLDAGGVRKEFFELLSSVLFTQDSFRSVGTNVMWINPTGTNAQALRRLRPALERRNPHFTPLVLCVDSYSCFQKCGSMCEAEGDGEAQECSVCGFTRPVGKKCASCKYVCCNECIQAELGLEQEMMIHHQLVLTGALMGLAVYNNTLINVHFPSLLYSALLGKNQTYTFDLPDLFQVDPELARSLQYLMDFAGTENEFQDVFEGSFENNEHVTMDTRADYIARRVRFELKDGVGDILLAMKHGFESVLDVSRNNAMQLLSPGELEMLIIGVEELNFEDLKEHCKYEGGYTEKTKVIKWFWELVTKEMTEEDQRLLLTFSTGSSHAPIGGLKKQEFLIQRAGPDTNQLPTSSTCFHTLLLPEYSSKKKLKQKLTIALRNAQGFGLQ